MRTSEGKPRVKGYKAKAKESSGTADHDGSYKNLFSHPEMVEDLLKGFVREEWVREVDFSTLEKVSGNFVSDDLRDREDDIIWRVRLRETWLYVYLLLEFQSSIDPFMAVRILVYVGLLYQDLIKSKQVTSGQRLPPVLPVVLYNGGPRWHAAQRIEELIEEAPLELEAYRPRIKYLLLDEGAYAESELESLKNLAAALFRLENSRRPQDMQRVVECLLEWLGAEKQSSLRRAFTVWMKRVLLPGRIPGRDLPEVQDLQEVRNMLAERVKNWTEEWKQEGRQEGRQEGQQEGRQQGISHLLRRLIEKRFGVLPREIIDLITEADPAELERWGENLLDARSLEEVFRI